MAAPDQARGVTGRVSSEGDTYAAVQAPVSRRSCRQPAAIAGAEGGASQARKRRHHRRAIAGGRGPRDRRHHQEAGIDRAAIDHRRRIPPRVLELRFPRQARRRRGLSRRAQDQVPGQAAQADDAAGDRQARVVQRSPDDRAFQVRRRAHPAHAEDDDPLAVVAALPLWALGGAGGDLSGHGRLLPRPRPELPQGGARLRRRRLPLSAARRGQLHLSVRPGAAAGRSTERGDDP